MFTQNKFLSKYTCLAGSFDGCQCFKDYVSATVKALKTSFSKNKLLLSSKKYLLRNKMNWIEATFTDFNLPLLIRIKAILILPQTFVKI